MDCRIVFVLLSFGVCVLEQLVGTYGFSARGMTILKGQIPQHTRDVFFCLNAVVLLGSSWQHAVPILELGWMGGSWMDRWIDQWIDRSIIDGWMDSSIHPVIRPYIHSHLLESFLFH